MQRQRTGRICGTIFLGLLAAGAALSAASRAETSVRETLQINQGRELAQVWCQQCHLIDPEGAGFVQSNVPTFAEIANRPDQTRDRIKLFLVEPHPPMPNLNLSRDEIENLTSYILSLRGGNTN